MNPLPRHVQLKMALTELIARLRDCADRAKDINHPKGWLTYWGEAEIALVLEAAETLERCERESAPPADAVRQPTIDPA